MYKRITILTLITIFLTISVVLIFKDFFTDNVTGSLATIPPKLLQKFDENYPSKSLFPYKSNNLVADYELEPKNIYIKIITGLDHEAAFLEIDTYLKGHNESIANLQDRGVKFFFTEPTSSNIPKILD